RDQETAIGAPAATPGPLRSIRGVCSRNPDSKSALVSGDPPMPVIRRLLPSILLAAAAGCAGAPHPAPPAPPSLSPTAVGRVLEPESASRQGYVPEEVPERPLPPRQGIGNSHDAV